MDDDKAENMDTTSALLAMNLPGVEVCSLTQLFTFSFLPTDNVSVLELME